ncbi:MAG: PAS domain S-box protein [Paludibacter sp.]|nr:PAS domain S-box protein [Paludibacter sp.]
MNYESLSREELLLAVQELQKQYNLLEKSVSTPKERLSKTKTSRIAQTDSDYKFLIENINDIVYEYDSNGILKYISPVVEKTFGFTPADILGKNFIQFVGATQEYATKILNDLREKGEIHTEYQIPTKTGEIRWAYLSTKAVYADNVFLGGAGVVTDVTDRKHLELELKRRELLYRSILNASPDPITITDLEGKILLISSSVENIFGFDPSFDFTNHSIIEFIAEQDHEKATNAMMRMFQNEFPGAEEYKGVKADGSTFDIEVNGEFIRDENGQPLNLIFVTRDITLRKQADDKLKEAQESYRNLVENVNDVIYDLDQHGVVRFVSPTVYKMTGYTPEELVGKHFMELFGENVETFPERIAMLIENGSTQNEYQIQTKSGEFKWVRYSSKAVFENDILLGATGTLIDITEQKNIALELQENEALYRTFVMASPDAITIADMEGRILFSSPVNNKLFGFDPSYSFIGQFAFDFGSEKDREKAVLAINSKLWDAIPGVKEYTAVRRDGSTFDIEVNIELIRDNDNQPVKMFFISRDISQRKLLQKQLEDSEYQYRNLVENINEIIYEIDEKGIVKYVSPSIQQMGYQPEEMIGRSFLDFAGEKAGALYQNLLSIKKGEQITNEYEMYSKDGRIHWLRFSTKAVYDTDGNFTGGRGTLVDVTEKRNIEMELQKSEALYSTILHVSPDAMTIINFDGTIVFASPANYKIFGYDPSYDLTNRSVFDFIAPIDKQRAFEDSMLKLEGVDIGVIEYKGVRADGSLFDFEINSEFILDINNNPVQLLLIIRDITNRKLLEQQLKKTEENYRNMVERINDVVFEVTIEGTIKFVSPAIERVLGYTTQELTGKNFFSYMYPDDIPYLSSALADLANRDSSDLEYRYYKKDGTVRWVRSSTKPTFEDGVMVGGIGVLIDINERKLAEASLRKSEEKYRSIFETVQDAYYEASVDGELLDVSPSIITVSEGLVSREDFIGKSFVEYYTDPIARKRLQDELYSKGRVMDYEIDFTFNNITIPIAITTSVVFDNEGNPLKVVGSLRNISERRKNQEELRLSELRYKSFFEGNTSIMILVDPETGEIKDANPAASLYYGWSNEEICRMNISEINVLTPDEVAAEMQLAKKEERKHFFFKHRLANGETHDVEVYSGPIVFGGNTLLYSIVHDITERVVIENALRESEEKYRSIFETVQDAYYEASVDGILLDISPAIEIISRGQFKREDLIGKSLVQFYADPDARAAFYTQLLKTGYVNDYELAFENKDGSIMPVAISSTLVCDVDGNPVKITGSMRDILERKQAEEEIKASEERYRLLFSNNPQPMWIYDLETLTILEVNQSAVEQYGYTREEFLQMTIKDIRPVEDINDMLLAVENKQNNNSSRGVWKHVWKNGDLRYVEISGQLINFNGANACHVLINDITEQIHAETELRESEERYRLLFSNNPQPMWIYDLETLAILEVNQSSIEQYGYTREEFLQMTIKDVRPAEDIPDLLDDVAKGIKNKGIKGVWRHIWKKGELRYVEISAQSIDFNGRNARHVLINDITDRVLVENEIKAKSVLLTNLIINLKEGILLEDADRKIILTNQLFCDMFSIPVQPEMMVGADCTNSAEQSKHLFKDPDKFLTDINLVHANKIAIFNDELELADGRFFERDYIPTYLEDTYSGHLWKYRDITERKLAEKSLKERDERFSQVVAQSQEVVWEVDADGLYTYVSPMAEDVYGYAPEELVGKLHFYDLCPIEERDMLMQAAFDIFGRKEDIQNLVNKVLRPDFTEVILLTNGIPMLDEQGELIGYRGIDANITEQKRAEEELIKFRTITDQANSGAFIASLDGTFLYVNNCFANMVGWLADDLIGKNVQDVQSMEHLSRLAHIGDLIRNHGGFVSEELYYTRKDGSSFPTLMTAKVISDANQVPQFVSSTLVDITERKLAEENFIRLNRLRSVISNINQAIITEKAKSGLLEKVCNIAIESGKFQMTWIGLVDEETKIVKPSVFDGFENGYLSQIKPISIEDNPEGRGPTGIALREGRPFVCNDIENDPRMDLWRNEAMKRNYRSAISLPLKQFDKIFGSLNIYSAQPNFFNAEEIELLVEVVDNISNALSAIETENERKLAETELRKLSQVVEQSPVSIVITNLDGNIEYANPKACETTGYTLNELLGQNPRVLQSGETPKNEYTALWETISAGKEWRGTFHNKKKTGELYWESSTIASVTDETGNITHYVAVKEDITDRKKMEEDLIRSEAALNYAQELAKMGSWMLNYVDDTNVWSANEYRLLGLEPFAEVDLDKHFFSNIHPDDKYIFEMKLSPSASSFQFRYILPDGAVRWFSANIDPVIENDEIVGLNGTHIDITEQKQKDDQINKLSQAVEQSPILVVITDLDGHIEYVNPAFTHVTGYSSEEVNGKSTKILKSGKTDKAVYADLWNTISSGMEWHNEWINKKKNGELYWESVSITPIHDESGSIINYLAVKQDISERKKAEQEIRELNENLEIRIQQRTEQLAETNNELLRAIEERKRLDEALIASEQSYQTVVENVNEVIFQTDAEGLWLFLNKAWEGITGFTVEESVGQLFLNYVHPDDRQRNMDLFAPLINREKEYCRHEVRYLTKDGGFRWIEVFARLGVNDKDEITGTYGTLQDISERKRAEDFENEMLRLSPQLTGITANEINSALNLALSRIGKFLNADRAYIFEFDAGNDSMSNTYEWCNAGINPEIDNLQSIPCEILPMWMGELKNHRNIIIPSIKALPESWKAEREILEPQGIQSLIVIPMLIEERLIGFVGLDSVLVKRDYSMAEINILKVWSSMLASLINNSRTEGLLEQTRQNFETFFNTIDDFLWVLDDTGNIIHINNTVLNRLGYSAEELETKSILKVHPVERRDEAGRIVGEMLQGITEFCPVPVVTKSGQQIPVETRVKHGYWNGQSAIFGVSKDISKIQLSEQKFSTAFQSNSALMAISMFDGGQYLDVNNTFLEVLDYSREEVIGKTNAELGFFPDKKLRGEIIKSIEENGPVRKLEAIIRRRDGKLRTVLLSGDTIYLGETKCLLTVSVDISERKQAEEEIREARLEAEKANVAKSEFLSRMSHELRTPMNSILGFAQLLEMGELNPGQKKGVNHIMRSGKHLLSLINEVLDISRIEAGRLSISIEPIKIDSILEEMIDVLKPMSEDNEVNIRIVPSEDNKLFVNFDRQSMKQVMLNLLNNAIKYNRPGGSVTISTQLLPKTTDDKLFVRISIADTGFGISSEDIPKLFTPFERIGASKTAIEGTGLGLAVVKKLIDAMGGFLGVESVLGEGTTFWIDLPKAESQLETLHQLDNIPSGVHAEQAEKRGTILYIEDNASNIELIEQILLIQRPEIELISNSHGKYAVKLATEYKPDLILLDLNLPDIHGSEVLKLLLKNEKTKHIPVVVISADAMHKQVETLLNAGAKTYLTKPLEVADFLRVIDEYIFE